MISTLMKRNGLLRVLPEDSVQFVVLGQDRRTSIYLSQVVSERSAADQVVFSLSRDDN